MTINESWLYQGRQGHGYFGNGTAPEGDLSNDTAGVNELFRPASAGQRVDYIASSLIMHVPRNERGRWNSAVSDSARANLKNRGRCLVWCRLIEPRRVSGAVPQPVCR